MTSPSPQTSIDDQLNQIRSQLNKKQTFETAVATLKSLLLQSYSSSSPPTKKHFYDVVSRVATVLRTRYTAPGFLLAGIDLLETASRLSADPTEVSALNSSANSLRCSVQLDDDDVTPITGDRGRFLFEGHLTVDPTPPPPNWLNLQQGLFTVPPRQFDGIDNQDDQNADMLRELVESLDVSMLEDLLPADVAARRAAPPASKEVVEKLPVVEIDENVAEKIGEDGECCICKERLVVGDTMQEMPCKHLFHPLCLKPWLDEHNSCPICRHELPTDDHKYESWKEREKELDEERRGAANAVREGQFMYV